MATGNSSKTSVETGWLTFPNFARFHVQHAPESGGFGFLTCEAKLQVVPFLFHLIKLQLKFADAVDPLLTVLASGDVVALALERSDVVDGGRASLPQCGLLLGLIIMRSWG